MTQSLISLQNVHKIYQTGAVAFHALQGVDLTIEEGEFVAIMGASGSGKSTLLHILGLLDVPDQGHYQFMGQDITTVSEQALAYIRNQVAGFIFQQYHLLPGVTALQNVNLPQLYAPRPKSDLESAKEKLASVGLAHRILHVPNALSGGERQRVGIARALVQNPCVLFADEPTGNLDTKSESEILEILKDLNRKGMTIVMVTHEQEVAAEAHRIIKMRDGKIVSDERVQPKGEVQRMQTRSFQLTPPPFHLSFTKGFSHIQQAFQAMKAKKLRTFLALLGILIGVAAVIVMMSIGRGASESVKERLSSLGANRLVVRSGIGRQGSGARDTTTPRFKYEDSKSLRNLAATQYVSGQVSGRIQAVVGNQNWPTTVRGVEPDYAVMRDSVPNQGRFFTEKEVQNREKVAVIGQTVATSLFGTQNPIGSKVKINRISFRVVGVLPVKGSSSSFDQDDVILLPITTAMYRMLGKQYVDSFEVDIVSQDQVDSAMKEIDSLLRQNHNVPASDESFLDIRNMAEIQAAIQGTVKTISVLLGAVAGISLIVGGIGIMNIMLVSVTERTREIGLRKALGATQKDILFQFLIESVVVTTTGGILGIIIGYGISKLIGTLTGWMVVVTPQSISLSTGFALVIGLVFGLWPANQAARLKTVDALRYE